MKHDKLSSTPRELINLFTNIANVVVEYGQKKS